MGFHGVEAAIWGAAYLWLGAIGSTRDAMLYSVDSITTRGASGLELEPEWRLMGALEAADGMRLFGISTAFVFAVIQQIERIINQAEDYNTMGSAVALIDETAPSICDNQQWRTKNRMLIRLVFFGAHKLA